jgi:anaerobic dimethyl sulfoxide reductase subunit B (iron-sulfur subunit)
MTYAFTFDAKFCSGCKACQAACKDKNHLPVGVLWRRVVEVTGGTWDETGDAWRHSVFAYNLSLSCNHCVHPKCAGVCPTGAYVQRDDGIVFLDPSKCMGCGYCAWVCPYGAPQYNPESGSMTKCDFCADQLEQGLPPACVAACPMRVLDYGEADSEQVGALWNMPSEMHPYPLPGYSHTQPHLAIKPHPAMNIREKKSVANQEEIQPHAPSGWEDVPLILFTLLAQIAVGGFWVLAWINTAGDILLLRLLIGICLGLGMLASFAHLGSKRNAWRALTRIRKSSLSREVLFAGLFGLGWLWTMLENLIWQQSNFESTAITAIFGIGLIYNMSQVYRFPAAPGWNTWRTHAGFMLSALLLGLSVMTPVMAYQSALTGTQISPGQGIGIGGSLILLLLAQLALSRKLASHYPFAEVRIGLIWIGITLSALSFLLSSVGAIWISTFIFMIVLTEEILGRWLFYCSRM